MHIKLDKDYEVKTTLGTICDIEKTFGKGFFELAGEIGKMTTDQQIKLLYVGVRKAQPEIAEETFNTLCENHLGLGDMTDYLEQFILQLQYPGFSREEIQKKIEMKMKQAERLKGLNGMK